MSVLMEIDLTRKMLDRKYRLQPGWPIKIEKLESEAMRLSFEERARLATVCRNMEQELGDDNGLIEGFV